MNNQAILTKAIQKAIDGGWNKFGEFGGWGLRFFDDSVQPRFVFMQEFTNPEATGVNYSQQFTVSDLLSNHDFAKALWGEKHIHNGEYAPLGTLGTPAPIMQVAWQYHLQQMVIADDPIKYLGEHI